jgi:5-formyltetrahydrofolate cyclo-ligase
VRALGLAYACQEVAEVPASPADEPLDGVVTEAGPLWFDEGRGDDGAA